MSDELAKQKPVLFGMIMNPKEQFDRIKERPVFWGALLIVIILISYGMWLSLAGFDITKVANMEELKEFSKDEIVVFEMLAKLTFIFIGLLGPILRLLVSTILFLLFAKSFQSHVSFKQLFSMNTYILFITSLGIVLNGIFVSLIGGDSETVITSLGIIINSDGPIGILLNSIELFTIWGLILTAIGLQKVAGLPKKFAWGISIIFFVVTVILTITSGSGAEVIASL